MTGLRCSFATVRLLAAIACTSLTACAGCGPETTSFRALDKGDDSGLPGAAYDVRMGELPIAKVHVWSNGGYISVSDVPMTHFGFEIRNTSTQTIALDTDAFALTLYDNTAAELPGAELTSIGPNGPTLRPIRPEGSILLGVYFAIPARPRAIEAMQIGWAVRAGDQRYFQVTRFMRDDGDPVVTAPRVAEVPRLE